LISVVVPVYGCDQQRNFVIRGAVKLDIDLDKVELNQCSDSVDAFAGTHRCHKSTWCATYSRAAGLKRGNYQCRCTAGHYFPPQSTTVSQYFDGVEVETEYSLMTAGLSHQYDKFVCLLCARGCTTCDDNTPCDDVITTRAILLAVQIFTVVASVAVGVAIVRLRKTKVMKASFWFLLEIIIVGILLVLCTVVAEYFDPSDTQCLLVPWFREVGFTVVYGALMLKAYRVLAEFQSRKAQRILLRDKDLLKYLLTLVIIVIAYMVTWTVITLEHVTSDGDRHLVELRHIAATNMTLSYCTLGWWHYVIEIGECVFLCVGIYLCYCIRSAPTFYLETKFITVAIFNELFISAIFYVIRHCVWSFIEPTYLYLLSFLRCQLTITVTLLLVICTKVWYTHRPPSDRRRRQYSTSDPASVLGCESISCTTDSIRLGPDSCGLPAADVAEINLADMNPDDIRAELRRLYMQLQVYKTKSMRRDNPHISKRRGGRKPTHRRFSLQAFNYKHRLHQGCSEHSSHDLEPVSRTPEESTNSADVVPTVIEEPASVDSPRRTSLSTRR
jgi:G protein-coupled receptor 158